MATDIPKEVIDDLNFNSDRISAQVRVIGAGLVALVWALLLATDKPQLDVSRSKLLWVAVLAITAMIFDLAQYVVGYILSLRLLRLLERGKAGTYDPKSPLYRMRTAFFGFKVVTVAGAFIYFIVVIGGALKLW